MIEWIPIEDFEFTPYKTYLVIYKADHGEGVGLIIHNEGLCRHTYAGNDITHAAYVNFPAEGTAKATT